MKACDGFIGASHPLHAPGGSISYLGVPHGVELDSAAGEHAPCVRGQVQFSDAS
jgi:hypothetical protein